VKVSVVSLLSWPLLTSQDEQVIHLRLPILSLIPNAETGYQVEDGDIFIFLSRNVVSRLVPPQELMSVGRVIAPVEDRV